MTMSRSAKPAFFAAGVSLVLALSTGVAWLGQPLRLVQLITLLGLGMMTGVSWAQGVARLGEARASTGAPAAGA